MHRLYLAGFSSSCPVVGTGVNMGRSEMLIATNERQLGCGRCPACVHGLRSRDGVNLLNRCTG